MRVDYTRDALLNDFSKATLKDRYLLPEETNQDLFARVAKFYGNDDEHSQRLYDYMSKLWFMPATPILSNGGTNRGLPISCFLSESDDDMLGIAETWWENIWLAQKGGGIGTYWGNVRSVGERIGKVGESSGVVPFMKVQDSLTLAVSQGSLRRGSAALYLPIHHPEIEEFIDMRRPTGGDPNRKALNLHHGIAIDDAFMNAVKTDGMYSMRSPKDGSVLHTVKARDLWSKILTTRIETGEPYMLFIDTVNKAIPEHHKKLGLKVKTSNLCVEITLPTGRDHLNKQRTAVCCLSSLNLDKYDEWKDNETFVLDVMYFLDNVLEDFIQNAPDTHAKAKYAAMRERSVGLGVMGLHYLYQQRGLAFGSAAAYELNREVFQHFNERVNSANQQIAEVRGACPDAAEVGVMKRFSNATAIAPTASISIIAGGASPGVEPCMANVYVQKTLSGSFEVHNPYLQKILADLGKDNHEVWASIASNEGSVQHLDFLSPEQKEVFKTFEEIEQMDIIRQAGDRQPYVHQSQSVNVLLRPDVSKLYLHLIHMKAWELGLKSLYYCRSVSLQRADKISHKKERQVIDECPGGVCEIPTPQPTFEECTACQ